MSGMRWTLLEMLAAGDFGAEFTGEGDALSRQVRGVSIDSRKVEPGEVFFAIKGERFDGHDFVQSAFARHALAVVVSREWWQGHRERFPGRNVVLTDSTLRGLQKVARAYRRLIVPDVLALTGTNGKTTTKEMIANVLGSQFAVQKTAGNLNNHIGVPLTLLGMRPPVEVAVVEMGANHFNEIATLCTIAEPNAGLITNIGRGHTEFFHNILGVRKAKRELFEYLAAGGLCFVNVDDENVLAAAATAEVSRKVTYGFQREARVRGKDLTLNPDGCAMFSWDGRKITVGVPGIHNAINALAAVAVGVHYGVSAENIAKALAEPITVGGRMRKLEIAGRVVIDDSYNANPESVCAALQFLEQFPGRGRRFAVLGDMLELGSESVVAHQETLAFAQARGIDAVLVYGPEMQKALAAWPEAGESVVYFDAKEPIAEELAQRSQPGDVILIKGSRGMQMEEVLEQFEKAVSSEL